MQWIRFWKINYIVHHEEKTICSIYVNMYMYIYIYNIFHMCIYVYIHIKHIFMCISTIDIQIDLFCQQLAATKRSKRAWSKRRPRRPWRFRTRTSKHSRFPRWKFVGSFPYPKIWYWLWKLCLKDMVFDVLFFF